jgi:hypothetical protein
MIAIFICDPRCNQETARAAAGQLDQRIGMRVGASHRSVRSHRVHAPARAPRASYSAPGIVVAGGRIELPTKGL